MIYTVTLNPALDRQYTVEEITRNEVLRARDCRIDLGGKGFNVSRALQRLGVPSVAIGFVGGLTGKQLAAGLDELGIQTEFVSIAEETRTNTSITSLNQNCYIKVNEPGPVIKPKEIAQLQAKIRSLATPGDWWVLSGSLPRGIPGTFYADLVRDIQSEGAQVCLDTSGEPLRQGYAANPRLIKPNLAEFSELMKSPHLNQGEAISASKMLPQESNQLLLLSMGMHGALLRHGDQMWLAKVPTVAEGNPIGAGDALIAGFLAALSGGERLPAALCWGVASGSCAASLPGTAFGSTVDLEQMLPLIHSEQL